jgi:hypothetical protein
MKTHLPPKGLYQTLERDLKFMSKHNDSSAEDYNQYDELSLEPVIEQGPTPAIAPQIGTIEKVLTRYTHCEVCAAGAFISIIFLTLAATRLMKSRLALNAISIVAKCFTACSKRSCQARGTLIVSEANDFL